LITDKDGLPHAFHVEKAGRHDRHATGGIEKEVPKNSHLVADRGYDCKKFRRHLRRLGLKPVIPKRQFKGCPKVRVPKPKVFAVRWRIERTFSWLEVYRRLNCRYEYKVSNWKAFWNLACTHLILRKITG